MGLAGKVPGHVPNYYQSLTERITLGFPFHLLSQAGRGSIACSKASIAKSWRVGILMNSLLTTQDSAMWSMWLFNSVQFSRTVVSDSLWPYGLQHARLPWPSPTPVACLNSCPMSRWCHPSISSSVIPFSSYLQSFLVSGSFPRNQFFSSSGQSVGVSALASVLPMNIQDWFPLGLTGWISLQSKGLSRVFSNTTVQKHKFFSAQNFL